jgi:outer membrane protein TolC
MFRIREGNRVARADEAASLADLDGLRNQIALTVRQIYYGLIAAQLDRKVADDQVLLADEEEKESAQQVRRGEALDVSLTEARTRVVQAKQDELSARIRQLDLFARLDEILGLRPGTQVEVDPQVSALLDLPDKAECIHLAQSASPNIGAAEDVLKKADAAVRAARYEYIPDVSFFARHDYQNGVAFLYHNYGVVGAEFNFKIFDGGKRRAEIGEREAQLRQAVQNLARLKDEAAANVQVALDKIDQSHSMVDLANQVLDLRTEAHAIAVAQQQQEVILHSKLTEAETSLSRARADLAKAQLADMQAQAELEVLIGRLPR